MSLIYGHEPTNGKMDRRNARGRKKGLSFAIREIVPEDLENGFLETLRNLSDIKVLRLGEASRLLLEMKLNPFNKIFVAVKKHGEVIGATTLIIEQKFIHSGGRVGHIEDVAVRKGYEGNYVGSALVRTALKSAKQAGCYKCILDCNERLTRFYEKLGFIQHGFEMRKDLL